MIAPTLPSASRSSLALFSEVLNGAPGATSTSPSKNQRARRLMSSSRLATRPSRDIDMSAISLVIMGSLAVVGDCRARSRDRRAGTSARWPRNGTGLADGRLPEVAADLVQPSIAAALWFVAADGGPAGTATTGADALASVDALRRAHPQAVIAVHLADREATGTARARRLCEIGRPGQTLVSAAAAAALPPGAALHDLGVHRLRDLSLPERVFALGEPGAAPLRSLDAAPNNLPSGATGFVGREAELDELHGRLAYTRLLTIIGPGGSGKTRLAAQLAAED